MVESLIVGYQLSSATSEITLEEVQRSAVLPPLVPTSTVLRNMDLFSTWLAQDPPGFREGFGAPLVNESSFALVSLWFALRFPLLTLPPSRRTSSATWPWTNSEQNKNV